MRRIIFALVLAQAAVARAEPPADGQVVVDKQLAAGSDGGDDRGQTKAASPAARPGPTYHGVTPGQNRPPPPTRGPAGKGVPRLTWVGFELRAGVPTVFVQLSRPVAWSVTVGKGQLVYTLVGAAVPLANNRRPLQVEEFATAVKTVTARQNGHDVEVTITHGVPVSHAEHIENAAAGMKFLVIELGPPA